MKVKLKAEATQKLSALSTRNYPAGWTGEVPDGVGQEWIDAGLADAAAVASTADPAPQKPKASKGKGPKAGKS